MNIPPPLPDKTPNSPPPEEESSGMVALVFGGLAVLAAVISGIALFAVSEAQAFVELGLPLSTAVLAFLALFAGIITFFVKPDAKHSKVVIGMTAGGLALILLGVVVVSKRMVDLADFVSSGGLPPGMSSDIPVKPVVVNEGTLTAREFGKSWEKWLNQHVVSDVQSGLTGEKTDAVVTDIFDGFVKYWANNKEKPTREEWNRLTARLGNYNGPSAPAAKLIAADRSERSINLISMNSVIKGLRENESNPFLLFILELQRGHLKGRTGNQKEKEKCYRNALNALDEMLKRGWFPEEDTWLLADLTEMRLKDVEKTHGEELLKVYESHDLPEWFMHFVKGKHEIRKAWRARGGGYSDTVSESGWQDYNDFLALAQIELEKSWELAPEYPFAATELIQVAMGISSDPRTDMRLWLDRALAASCDNRPAIKAWMWGMRPRWHGSQEAIFKWGENCLETGRFDTSVPRKYIDALKEIASDDGSREIYHRPGVYESINEIVEGYLAANDSPANQIYWRTTRAVLALRCENYEDVRADWLALDGNFSEDVLASWSHNSRDLLFRSHFGKGDEDIEDAVWLESDFDFQGAAEIYREAIQKDDYDAEQKKFLKNWIALLELQERYEDGEEIDLIHEGPDFWRKVEGDYRRNAKGEMIVSSDTTRFAIEHFLILGPDFEASVEIATPEKVLRDGGAGLHFTNRTFAEKRWSTCYVKDLYSGVRICKVAYHRYAAYLEKSVPVTDETRINLICQDNLWKIAVNDKSLHPDTVDVKSNFLSSSSRLCLGGWTSFPVEKCELTYRSLKVKKLEPLEKETEDSAK